MTWLSLLANGWVMEIQVGSSFASEMCCPYHMCGSICREGEDGRGGSCSASHDPVFPSLGLSPNLTLFWCLIGWLPHLPQVYPVTPQSVLCQLPSPIPNSGSGVAHPPNLKCINDLKIWKLHDDWGLKWSMYFPLKQKYYPSKNICHYDWHNQVILFGKLQQCLIVFDNDW